MFRVWRWLSYEYISFIKILTICFDILLFMRIRPLFYLSVFTLLDFLWHRDCKIASSQEQCLLDVHKIHIKYAGIFVHWFCLHLWISYICLSLFDSVMKKRSLPSVTRNSSPSNYSALITRSSKNKDRREVKIMLSFRRSWTVNLETFWCKFDSMWLIC